MLTREDVMDALRACFDPGSGRDLVEAGLVTSVELLVDEEAPGFGIAGVPVPQRLRLLLAGNDDADREALIAGQVSNRLAGIEGLSRVELGWKHAGNFFPILNNRLNPVKHG